MTISFCLAWHWEKPCVEAVTVYQHTVGVMHTVKRTWEHSVASLKSNPPPPSTHPSIHPQPLTNPSPSTHPPPHPPTHQWTHPYPPIHPDLPTNPSIPNHPPIPSHAISCCLVSISQVHELKHPCPLAGYLRHRQLGQFEADAPSTSTLPLDLLRVAEPMDHCLGAGFGLVQR